jgi:hypothetical protein
MNKQKLLFKKKHISVRKIFEEMTLCCKKNCIQRFFFVYFTEKTTSGIHLHSKNLLDSLMHGVTQAFGYSMQRSGGPQDVDLPDELGQGPVVLALELLLHVVLTIIYWV